MTEVTIPTDILHAVLGMSGSAALRTILAVCAATQDGVAVVSARELAVVARLNERSVFAALAKLERAGVIERQVRDPGPFANEIVLSSNMHSPASVNEANATPEAESAEQQQPQYLTGIASCFRSLTSDELWRTEQFIDSHLRGDRNAFHRAVTALQRAGGVDSNSSTDFFLNGVFTMTCQSR